VVAVCVLAGCGSTTISTDSAKSTLQAAGFHGLVVFRHVEIDESIGEIDSVELGSRGPWVWRPVQLLRYRSSGTAAKAYKNVLSRAYFTRLIAYWRHPPKLCSGCVDGTLKLPRGFQMRKVMTFRICNLILWSYNARLDARLTVRVNRAASLLRVKCR